MEINLNQEFLPFEKLPKDENKIKSYFDNVNLGKKICKESKIAVVSLARNCEKNLQKSIDQIVKLESSKFKFFIYENDSNDKTKDILKYNQEKNSDIDVSLNTDNSEHRSDGSRERTKKLANYRNHCLKWVIKNCPDFDYVIVLDLDPDLGFSINGVYNSISWLNRIPKSAGMGSYSTYILESKKIIHYDTFAIRLNSWHPSTKYRQEEKIFSNFHPKIGSDPILFYSCFGGLAVYKNKAFSCGNYDGSIGCEHVLFHKSIIDKGYKMYLNPSSRFFAVAK